MKKFLIALFALSVSSSLFSDTEILRIGFEESEGYALGKIIGQKGWTSTDSRHSPQSICNVTNRASIVQSGSQALCLRVDGDKKPFLGRSFTFSDSLEGKYVVMSGDFLSPQGCDNWVKFLCENEKEMATVVAKSSGDEHNISLDCYDILTAKSYSLPLGSYRSDAFHTYKLTVDPARKLIVKFELDENCWTNTDTLMMGYHQYTTASKPKPFRFALECDVSADNLYVGITDGSSGPPELVVTPNSIALGKASKNASFSVMNNGGDSFDFKIECEGSPEWLSVTPESGTCAGKVDVKANLDRSVMTDGYYRAVIKVDGGAAGTKYLTLGAASGTVLIYENFEAPFRRVGEITGQGGWTGKRDDGYGKIYNEMLVTNVSYGFDGACAYIKRSDGWDAYTCDVNSENQAVVRVSMKIFKGSAGDEDSFTLHQDYWNNSVHMWFWRNEDHFYMYKFNDDEPWGLIGSYEAPLDTWLDLSFTVDYRSAKLIAFTLGDYATNYVDGIPIRNKPQGTSPATNYTKFGISSGGEETLDAMLLIDNLKVEQLEREPYAIPQWSNSLSFGEDLNSVTNRIYNNGSKKFKAAFSVLDYPDNVKPKSATATVTSSGSLVLRLVRSGLEDGFYRSRVVMDYAASDETNSGSITSLVTFAKGGWFYASEFEGSTYRLGDLNGQDTWKASARGKTAPKIALTDGAQCLSFREDGTAVSTVRIAAGSKYRASLRFYLKNIEHSYALRFTTKNEKVQKEHHDSEGNFPLYIMCDPMRQAAVVCHKPSGEEEYQILCEAPLGKWNTLAFEGDMDISASCVNWLSVNDYTTNFIPGEMVFDPAYDEKDLDQIELYAWNYDEEESSDTYVCVDNLVFCDSTLPEPAVFGLMLLALLLVKRR
ncbi:BACON domain-containing protein [bacterium]|nr:BACON domain-containing protein [bacterium]